MRRAHLLPIEGLLLLLAADLLGLDGGVEAGHTAGAPLFLDFGDTRFIPPLRTAALRLRVRSRPGWRPGGDADHQVG